MDINLNDIPHEILLEIEELYWIAVNMLLERSA